MSRGRRADSRADEAGFLLVEAIVALAILAAAIVLINSALAMGWKAMHRAEQEMSALAIAKARLASLGRERQLRDGTVDGAEGGHSWRLTIVRAKASRGAGGAHGVPTAYWVTIEVAVFGEGVDSGKVITLSTLEFGGELP